MKKFVSILLCVLLVFSFAACGSKGGDNPDTPDQEKPEDKKNPTASVEIDKTDINTADTFTITVKSKNLDFDANPYVCIVPDGEYKTEDDVDAADIWYEYINEDNQKIELTHEDVSLSDGKWLVVVCDTDGGIILCTTSFNYTFTQDVYNDGAEHDASYWANEYGTSICPMYIIVEGLEAKYYFRAGGELLDWAYTENNINNWYVLDDMLISYDNKYSIGPDVDSLSSFCDYTAEHYNGPTLTEEEQKEKREGILYVLNSYTPIVTNWGIALKTADEDSDWSMSCREINYDFKKDDSIQVFVDLYLDNRASTAEVYLLPHQADGYEMEFTEEQKTLPAVSAAFDNRIENDTPNAVLTPTEEVLAASEDGKFDMVFCYDGMVVCYTVINIE